MAADRPVNASFSALIFGFFLFLVYLCFERERQNINLGGLAVGGGKEYVQNILHKNIFHKKILHKKIFRMNSVHT